ncbi:MAG: PH domain-containing protein [Lachnospiraceae bacterium]|nr:PH domain-containing protein [Lachnospiraceae bacterium]
MRHLKNLMQIVSVLGVLGCIAYYVLKEPKLAVLLVGIVAAILLFVLSFFIKADQITEKEKQRGIIWKDRKRNRLGLPWTFTLYMLDKDRLHVKRGLITTKEDEVKLFRIVDVSLKRSLWQKLLGLGTVHLDSSDSAMQAFEIGNPKHPKEPRDMLSKLIDESRLRNRVISTESVNTDVHEYEDMNENGIPDRFE